MSVFDKAARLAENERAFAIADVHLHVIPYYREQPGGPLEWR